MKKYIHDAIAFQTEKLKNEFSVQRAGNEVITCPKIIDTEMDKLKKVLIILTSEPKQEIYLGLIGFISDDDKYYRNMIPQRIRNYMANINFISRQEEFGVFTFSIACVWKLGVKLDNTKWQDCDSTTLVTFGRTCVDSMLNLMITQMPIGFTVPVSVYTSDRG